MPRAGPLSSSPVTQSSFGWSVPPCSGDTALSGHLPSTRIPHKRPGYSPQLGPQTTSPLPSTLAPGATPSGPGGLSADRVPAATLALHAGLRTHCLHPALLLTPQCLGTDPKLNGGLGKTCSSPALPGSANGGVSFRARPCLCPGVSWLFLLVCLVLCVRPSLSPRLSARAAEVLSGWSPVGRR